MSIKQRFRTSMKKVNGDLLTPISIFQRLQGHHKFLLESSTKYEGNGRYSFIGVNPRKTYRGQNEHLQDISHLTNQTYQYEGELVPLLKQVMPRVSSHTEFPLTGGGIGYINALPESLPAMQFHVYDTLFIFDHLTDEIAVFHTNIEAEQVDPNIDMLIDELFAGHTPIETDYMLHSLEKSATNRYDAKFSGDAFSLYRKLRVQHAAAYMYYIEFDECTLIGTSPKSTIQIRNGELLTTNIDASIEHFCEGDSIHQSEQVQQGKLLPTFHAMDVVKELQPNEGLIGYIGFNGQIDFTTPHSMITITGDIAQLYTANNDGEVPFHTLLKEDFK